MKAVRGKGWRTIIHKAAKRWGMFVIISVHPGSVAGLRSCLRAPNFRRGTYDEPLLVGQRISNPTPLRWPPGQRASSPTLQRQLRCFPMLVRQLNVIAPPRVIHPAPTAELNSPKPSPVEIVRRHSAQECSLRSRRVWRRSTRRRSSGDALPGGTYQRFTWIT